MMTDDSNENIGASDIVVHYYERHHITYKGVLYVND